MNGSKRVPGRLPVGALFALVVAVLVLAGSRVYGQRQHVVASGDTLFSLAEQYDTSVTALRRENSLTGSLLRVGQVLTLPGEGPHSVLVPLARGESLLEFALRQGVPPAELLRLNGFSSLSQEVEDGVVLVPAGSAVGDAAPLLAAAATAVAPSDATATSGAAPALLSGSSLTAVLPKSGLEWHDQEQRLALGRLPELLTYFQPMSEGFVWPVEGLLSSAFGWRNVSVGGNRYHGGIDLAAPLGSPVVATSDGVVSAAGWQGAYGYAVYLEHADGIGTRYAHLGEIHVAVGDLVRQGDRIALVGSSGASTGPHLHFEIRIAGIARDPWPYLSPGHSAR